MNKIALKILIYIFIITHAVLYAEEKSSAPFMQQMFNPEIPVIVDMTGFYSNKNDEERETYGFPGYLTGASTDGKHVGFNFTYLELALSLAIDPYFEFFVVVAFAPDEIDVEEAYAYPTSFFSRYRLRYLFLLRHGSTSNMRRSSALCSYLDFPELRLHDCKKIH